jgi:hypothetical protein
MRFAFIHAERDAYPVAVLCRVMQVARSGYHAWAVREECDRRREDRVIAVHVAAAFERSRRTYGSPRIHVDLQADGLRVGRSRIARIMWETGLFARTKKAFRPAAARCARSAPNLLRRRFSARAPDRKWVTDVKYVRTSAGWLYLAPVLDLFSRTIVGCAMSTVQDGDLSVSALASAMRARGSPRGVLVHSDGGGIYGDEEYLKKLEEHGVKRSMSRKKNPWRLRGGQRGDRELLQHAALRAARSDALRGSRRGGARDQRVDRALLQPAPAAHDAWEREPDQLRIGLANAEAEDIINLSTESRQAQFAG